MDISRLQVEGGFLDGFDVKFTSGLNVLIGARGTGKTSVIELVRFVTGARNHTSEAEKRSADHIRAVLADGEVTVQLEDLFNEITVTRSLSDEGPRSDEAFAKPLIFSQTEIETLGLSERGRLRLIDSFIPKNAKLSSAEAASISAIRSDFKEISAAEEERAGLAEGIDDIGALEAQIGELEARLSAYDLSRSDVEDRQSVLAELGSRISITVIKEQVLGRFEDANREWAEALESQSLADFGPEVWDSSEGEDPLLPFREEYKSVVQRVDGAAIGFRKLANLSRAARESVAKERLALEGKSRALRGEIEKLVTGAGSISRQLGQLRTELAQRLSRKKLLQDRDRRIAALRMRRDEHIRALDATRADRHAQRVSIAERLNRALAPQINISVERYGQYEEYTEALISALRGSGLRYTELVKALAEYVSPAEIIEFVDNYDYEALSSISGIPKDRAARVLSHLRENSAVEIVTARIEDNIRMSLLDGLDYKNLEHLSAGQRCTVVLSIVLQHTGRTLIIDQPEDHLDNAYIATTVIRALRSRKKNGQVIISTHNANIPVLGDADLVIEMTSDGRNGFVQVCDKLTESNVVEAIAKVMEGGKQAFEDRAEFYGLNRL